MKTETKGTRNENQWTIVTQLNDLHFADDLALLSHNHGQMQDNVTGRHFSPGRVENQPWQKENKDLRLNDNYERPNILEGEAL